ncbi:DUF6538 domain-containing protein [Pseudogemmobacter bohemicus]|uniref:DUF6538 domain-containing protein n=1 Tax=Pseudogemmobacter bohemicus TaxID=2250708 RepID=UPI0013003A5E|nr:DUF6538 domain-containing protein [Pseudogemmobacter bohemicus]
MGITDFVFRRGATYVWRRRLPTALGGALLQVSLRTNEPLLARSIAAKVTVASNNLFEHMINTGLTRENARKLLDQVIRDEIERIQRRRVVESDDREENAWAANQSRDQMAAKAYRLLAERGRSASLSAAELEAMRAADLTDTDLARLDNFLELFRQDYWSDTRMRRIAGVLRDQFSLASPSATDLIQARQIMLRARGAAHHLMADRASTDMDEADALAAAIFEEFLQDQPDSAHATQGAFPPATVATTPLSAPPPSTEAVPPPSSGR